MKKLLSALLLIVVLGMAINGNTASANDDQLPKVFKTFSYTIQK